MWPCRSLFLVSLVLATLAPRAVIGGDETLCAIPPVSYAAAKANNPDMAFAISEVEQHATATWYSDRVVNGDYAQTAKQLVGTCPESSRLAIVVYGLPFKDCEAKESMVGSRNQNSEMYQSFVSTLQQTVGNRKALYVLEPDAVALLARGGCAQEYGYEENLAIAVRTLSLNLNAHVYLDVGHWMLQSTADLSKVIAIVHKLASQGRIKGISINTSNYRSTSELSSLCGKFRSATSDLNLHCIIDTSRNYNGPSSQDEWCNYKNAGLGELPTGNTGDPNIDYFVWLKTMGESDGTCAGRTSDAMTGPGAGEFFPNLMKQLWNNGALVKNHGLPVIDGTVRQTDTATPSTTAPPPPVTTTPAPTSPTSTPPPPSPSPTEEPQQSTNNSTDLESRSIDNVEPTPSPSSTAKVESRDSGAGRVVAAPLDQDPIFNNTPAPAPTTTKPSPEAPVGGAGEATTRSAGGGSMSTGLIALVCLVGVALVALVVVVAIRARQRSLEEHKSPLDPRIHYLGDRPGESML